MLWPTSLPQTPLISSYNETPPDIVIRTPMDAGPAKVRRRCVSGIRNFEVTYILTVAQVDTLDRFFVVACEGGPYAFTFPKPRDPGTGISVRFVEPPSYMAHDKYFRVTMKLEQLP